MKKLLPSELTANELDRMLNDLIKFYDFSFFGERGIDTAIGMTFAFEQMAISYGLVGEWLNSSQPEYNSADMVYDLGNRLDRRAHETNNRYFIETVRPNMPFTPDKAPDTQSSFDVTTEDDRYKTKRLPKDLPIEILDKIIADILEFHEFTFYYERDVNREDGLAYSIELLAVTHGLVGDWLHDSDENYNVAEMLSDLAKRLDERAQKQEIRTWKFSIKPYMPYLKQALTSNKT